MPFKRNFFAKDAVIGRIVKNSGIILSGNILASLLNLVSFTILARQLGAEALAYFVLAQTYVLIVNDLVNVQTWESLIKFGAGGKMTEAFAENVKTNVFIDVFAAVCACIISIVAARHVVALAGWDEIIVEIIKIYSLVIITYLTSLTIGIPRLFNKFKEVAVVHVFFSLLKLIAVAFLAWNSATLIEFVYVYLLAEMLINITLILGSGLLLRNKVGDKLRQAKLRFNKDQLTFIWWLNLRTIIRTPVRHFDMIIIGLVMSVKMVGIYKVYKEIGSLIKRIQDPINQAIYPEFTQLLASQKREHTARVAKTAISMLGLVSVFLIVAVLIAAPFIIKVFFGEEYMADINALYFLVTAYLLSFITVPVNSLFIASGFAKWNFAILLFTNTAYLLAAYYFGSAYGIYGIVIAYLIQLVFNKGFKIALLMKFSSDWGSVIR